MIMHSQTEKFSGAVPTITQESPSPVSMATEAEPAQEEHENMKNLLIANDDRCKLRRSRAVRSKGTSRNTFRYLAIIRFKLDDDDDDQIWFDIKR